MAWAPRPLKVKEVSLVHQQDMLCAWCPSGVLFLVSKEDLTAAKPYRGCQPMVLKVLA